MKNKAVLRESDHTYWVGDVQIPISVTQLLKKHGLSPSYSGVSEEVLSKKAERGILIHKEIEDYIKTGEFGFTDEFCDFIDIAKDLGFIEMQSEGIVNNEFLAGKYDLIALKDGGNTRVLADIKTTVSAHKKSVSWQLSLLERLDGGEFDEFYLILLGEKSKAIKLERIPTAEVDRLLECERNGEIYQEPGLVVEQELIEKVQQAELILKQAEAQKAAAEKTAKEYREILYDVMGKQKISSWETLDKSMLITRVEESTKSTIDGARLKKERPDIAAEYSKTSNTKGYVRITIREA